MRATWAAAASASIPRRISYMWIQAQFDSGDALMLRGLVTAIDVAARVASNVTADVHRHIIQQKNMARASA